MPAGAAARALFPPWDPVHGHRVCRARRLAAVLAPMPPLAIPPHAELACPLALRDGMASDITATGSHRMPHGPVRRFWPRGPLWAARPDDPVARARLRPGGRPACGSRQARLGQLVAKKYGTVSAGLMRQYDTHPEKTRKSPSQLPVSRRAAAPWPAFRPTRKRRAVPPSMASRRQHRCQSSGCVGAAGVGAQFCPILGAGNKTRVRLEAHARTERTCGVFPRDAQEGACVAARFCALPRCRGRSGKDLCRLQRGQDPLRAGLLTPSEFACKLDGGNK